MLWSWRWRRGNLLFGFGRFAGNHLLLGFYEFHTGGGNGLSFQNSFVSEKDLILVELEIFRIGGKKSSHIGGRREKFVPILFDGLENVLPHPRIFCQLSQGNLFGLPLIFKIAS